MYEASAWGCLLIRITWWECASVSSGKQVATGSIWTVHRMPFPAMTGGMGMAMIQANFRSACSARFNPQAEDDDGMGPVRRLTPEVGFPESQGGHPVYSTPLPLGENYHLCVYDAAMNGVPVHRRGRIMAFISWMPLATRNCSTAIPILAA